MYKLLTGAGILFCLMGTPTMASEPEQPSQEFLEFLGDWQDGEDGWLDPQELAGMVLPEEEHENDETTK